jgi:ArsR family transcriptional regulator
MNLVKPIIYDHLATLSDPVRGRILLLLERGELTVSELCSVLQLPQSTVSRHLKTLLDEGWVSSRKDGTSHRYAMAANGNETARRDLWRLLREQTGQTHLAREDTERLQVVLAERRKRSREFFSSAAGKWDRLRDEMFGPRFHLGAMLAFLDEDWVVGDLGCGTGHVLEALAPFVGRAVGVDESAAMVEAARGRLEGRDNVEVLHGDLESLPMEDGCLDAVTMIQVLHHQPHPAVALAEARRVLRPAGRLLLVDMVPHDREEYRQGMGHVWLGFSESSAGRYLKEAGFRDMRYRRLPIDPRARGPALFAATAGIPAGGIGRERS